MVRLLIHYTFYTEICHYRSLKNMFLINIKLLTFKHFRKYILNNVLTNLTWTFYVMFPFSALLLL
jgi:hypothetical protein